MKDYWIPDTNTCHEIKKLIPFVQLVANLSLASAQEEKAATEIVQLIETINQPETFKSWYIRLEIIGVEIWDGANKTGVYSRSCAVWFENDTLEIEATFNHTDDLCYYPNNGFYYSGCIYFKQDLNGADRTYLQQDMQTFINDALAYKKYITATLKRIEIELDV